MTEGPGTTIGGIRGARRRPVSLTELRLVDTKPLGGVPGAMPLVITPAREGVDLPGWASSNRDQLRTWLHEYGAVLFRGFGVGTPSEFEAAAAAAVADLYGDYGDLPREAASEKIFSSTPYPADEQIHFHNESSHMARWPMRIFFYCSVPARTGGETPILDCRRLCEWVDPDVLNRFAEKGLTYIRNFSAGVDVPWQQFFGTDDRAVVEERCRESGTSCDWDIGNTELRISQAGPGVTTHPVTGDRVFFNQVLLHHPRGLPAATRDSMQELYGDDDMPRNVRFGDGSLIDDADIEHLLDVYRERMVAFDWQQGDILMLDNMLVSHGRLPFTGARKTLVAMADIIEAV